MRARGAQVTDITILVVAADDGVMPQTVEAISHARAAEVPILVAVTKKDLPSADVQNVYRQLSEQNLLVEEWGGDIIAVPVSGITGDGISSLIENLLLVTEISELRANPERNARGVIIEARMERNRGSIATALVQTGTLRQGDTIVTGTKHGKIRAMFNDKGSRIQEAGPSSPVEIMGINEVPDAGIIFDVADNEKEARQMVDDNHLKSEREQTSLQDAYARASSTETHQVDLIVKTDVQGSVEAIKTSLEDLNSETSKVNLIHIASGNITERDVLLAIASDAVVIGFNASPEGGALAMARKEGIEIRQYSIIYNLIDDVSKALEGLLEPSYEEVFVGRASVRAVFNLGRRTRVAGMFVSDGRITRESTIHIMRGGEEIFVGEISTLKHFKNDVREVSNGLEGGLTLEGFNEFEEDDVLEAYVSEEV
jgi:translation initiation factor IF-2